MKLASVLSTLLVLDALLVKAGLRHPSKVVYQVFLRVAEADRDGDRLSKMCLQNELGIFYTSVQAAVGTLKAEGILTEVRDPEGGNRLHISLSTKGRAIIEKLFDDKATTEPDRPKPVVASTPRNVKDEVTPAPVPTKPILIADEAPEKTLAKPTPKPAPAPAKKAPAKKASAKPVAKKAVPAKKAPVKKATPPVKKAAPAKTPATPPAAPKTSVPSSPEAKVPSPILSPAAKALLAKTAPATIPASALPAKPAPAPASTTLKKVVFGKKK